MKPRLTRVAPAEESAVERGAPLDDAPLAKLTGYLITRAEARLRRDFVQAVSDCGLRPAEYSALVMIDAYPGASPRQLGEALDISPPNLAVLLDRLDARGLIERARSDTDRRMQELRLTTAGGVLLRRAEPLVRASDDGLNRSLSPGERLMLRELLAKVLAAD